MPLTLQVNVTVFVIELIMAELRYCVPVAAALALFPLLEADELVIFQEVE